MPEHRRSRSDAAQRPGRRELLFRWKRSYEGPGLRPRFPEPTGPPRHMAPRALGEGAPKRKLLARYQAKRPART